MKRIMRRKSRCMGTSGEFILVYFHFKVGIALLLDVNVVLLVSLFTTLVKMNTLYIHN